MHGQRPLHRFGAIDCPLHGMDPRRRRDAAVDSPPLIPFVGDIQLTVRIGHRCAREIRHLHPNSSSRLAYDNRALRGATESPNHDGSAGAVVRDDPIAKVPTDRFVAFLLLSSY